MGSIRIIWMNIYICPSFIESLIFSRFLLLITPTPFHMIEVHSTSMLTNGICLFHIVSVFSAVSAGSANAP